MTVEVTTLANGLRVVSHQMASVETVTLGIWVNAGARHETPDVNGIAHLLEHMAFKGTARRTARGIAEEIEAVGGHLNAHTSREFTAYYATVLKEDVALAVDIIADILQHSAFDETELARERAVVLQEIGEAQDTPDDVVFDSFQEHAFPDQPLGRPILGPSEIVSGMNRDQLVAYMGRHYAPSRMVLSAAGNLDHGALCKLAEAAFADAADGVPAETEPGRYAGGEARETRSLEQVHLVMGFEGVAYHDPDFFALSVMSTALGGGMSSRLFQEIREERGLVYSVYSFSSSYQDCGLFGVYAGTGEEQLGELVPVLCAELSAIRNGFSPEEIARARAQLKAGMLMSLESTASRCEQLARQMHIFGRPLPVEEIVARIEAVDEAAVARIASRVIASPLTVSAIGPVATLEPLESIAARLA